MIFRGSGTCDFDLRGHTLCYLQTFRNKQHNICIPQCQYLNIFQPKGTFFITTYFLNLLKTGPLLLLPFNLLLQQRWGDFLSSKRALLNNKNNKGYFLFKHKRGTFVVFCLGENHQQKHLTCFI